MAIKVPTAKKVKSTAIDSIKAGGLGGLAYGLGYAFLGQLGAGIGTIIAGSAMSGTEGDIVAINGMMDLVAGMMSGMGGRGGGETGGAI